MHNPPHVDHWSLEQQNLERQRIRIALGRYSQNHSFPRERDGWVKIRGQAAVPAWFGSHWKRDLDGCPTE